MKKSVLSNVVRLALLSLLFPAISFAQMNFSGQYMNRAEYRHGYGTLSTSNQLANFFISQRARLNAEYVADKYKFYLSAQDVRTWGNTSNLTADLSSQFAIYEAYGVLQFNKKLGVKFGRQAISYDDDRIFGSLDWAMQGRRHDAAVLQYADSSISFHLGAAYNANGEANLYTPYAVAGNYQSFEFLWLNKQIKKFNNSLLILNNGVVGSKGLVVCSQTLGLRSEYKSDKIGATAYAYYQMGQDASLNTLSAYDVSAEVSFKKDKTLQVTLGGELLSGTSQVNPTAGTNNSFAPLYGTNHRFNGYMDYFYVGNHANTVGLVDGYLKGTYTKKKVIVGLNLHYFSAAADVKDKTMITPTALNSYLGTEADLTLGYNITNNVALQAGYSQMLGSNTLVTLKGGQLAQVSNWAYLMVIMRPGKVNWPKTGLKM